MALKHIRNTKEAKRCTIVFSAFNPPSSFKKSSHFPFTFYKLLNACKNTDVIFVGDEHNSWYHGKIQGVENPGIDKLTASLQSIATDYEDILVIGASMGGHAALHSYCCEWVDRVIALQPQVFIKKGWPRFDSCSFRGSVPAPVLPVSRNYANSISFIVGQLDLFDIYQAWLYLGDHFSQCCTIVPNSYHNICYHWHRLGILDRAVASFVGGSYRPGFSPYSKPYQSNDVPELTTFKNVMPEVGSFFELMYGNRADFDKALTVITKLTCEHPQLKSLLVAKGLLLARLGQLDKAFASLQGMSSSLEDKFGPIAAFYLSHTQIEQFFLCLADAIKYRAFSPTDSFLLHIIPKLAIPPESLSVIKDMFLNNPIYTDHYPGIKSIFSTTAAKLDYL